MGTDTLTRYLILRKEELWKDINDQQIAISKDARTMSKVIKSDLEDFSHMCYEYRKIMELLDIYKW